MNHTENLNLPQWEASDPILRTDFNGAMESIDEAVASGVKTCLGSYTGNGTYGSGHPCTLTFTFEPKIIFMNAYNTRSSNSVPLNYIWVRGATSCASNYSGYRCHVTWSGNTVSWYADDEDHQFNTNATEYYYLAIG